MAHQLSGLELIRFLDSRILDMDMAKESYHPSILQILILTIILS